MAEVFRGSESGLSAGQLRRYSRIRRDVYALVPAAQTVGLAFDAAAAVLPDAVLSHHSAAAYWGLPVDRDGLLHVIRPPGRAVSVEPRTRTHRAALADDDVVLLRGRRVTSLPRTFLDLAGRLDHVGLVVLADEVVRRVGAETVDLRLARAAGARGVRRARAALTVADPGSDSPAETRTRLVLHGAGFTALRHRVDVCDAYGGWLARPDLADPVAKVAIQYDGLVHLGDDPERRRADIDRDELLRVEGWQVVVLTAIDLRHPDRMVAKVAAAYARAASVGF